MSITNEPDEAGARLLDGKLLVLLLAIDQAIGPIGSRQLVAELGDQGFSYTEPTMARRLRELDSLGLTVKVGSKGRTTTREGAARAREYHQGTATIERVRDASVIRTSQDLLNLLYARRAVEPEAVRSALASSENLSEKLGSLVDLHKEQVNHRGAFPHAAALNFHREIAEHATNPVLKAMLGIVFNDSTDRVERTLDTILVAHHHDANSVDEHAAIVQAMASRDADLAASLMREHIDRLVGEVLRFVAEHDSALVEQLLATHH
ncbi:DNA-binding GntR family transcriptional regulator [Arthrobacter sp. 1088]|uniref:FCD domain-containing protein n=1 Tax=Arthrobacter sp. 1088 TaxID=2817768 RepID=UPI00285BA755|nr:FCD domain-containing protein [Arthrobacter sp. 1088]MDR6687748.1 DNA-binding GntR family transcriptional regulator [Arthrobacter sp. 1088]